MTPLELEWANGMFTEATEEQLTELIRLIDTQGMVDVDIRVMMEWVYGLPYPGGARKMIELIKRDLARQ